MTNQTLTDRERYIQAVRGTFQADQKAAIEGIKESKQNLVRKTISAALPLAVAFVGDAAWRTYSPETYVSSVGTIAKVITGLYATYKGLFEMHPCLAEYKAGAYHDSILSNALDLWSWTRASKRNKEDLKSRLGDLEEK